MKTYKMYLLVPVLAAVAILFFNNFSNVNGSQIIPGGCTLNLPGDCDSPIAAYSVNQAIVSSYPANAPLFRAVRIPDLAATDILQAGQGTFNNGAGTPDITQVNEWLQASPDQNAYAVVTTLYDQSGNKNNATQTVLGSAPRLKGEMHLSGAQKYSLLFSNDMATAHAGYAQNTKEGSALTIQSLTDTNPSQLVFAVPGPPTEPGYPAGAPYPQLPPFQTWILPGFEIADKSLPANSIVGGVSANGLEVNALPLETKTFSNTVTITPNNVFLDLPQGVSVSGTNQSFMMAVRPGITGTQYFMNLGRTGEDQSGNNPLELLSATQGAFTATESPGSGHKPNGYVTDILSGYTSTDIDIYEMARDATSLHYNLGEMGSGVISDSNKFDSNLNGGSIGYTSFAQGMGSFEGFGFLVYPTAISDSDAVAIQSSLRSMLQMPAVPTTKAFYIGASTVLGHGIDNVLAPATRIGILMNNPGPNNPVAQNQAYPVQTYTVNYLSEKLLADFQSNGPLYQTLSQTKEKVVLVIHPTVSDSFGNFLSGQWPPICNPNAKNPLETCLWAVVQKTIEIAAAKKWNILVLGTEPKSIFFNGGNITLTNFVNFDNDVINGWQAAGANAFFDLKSNPVFGGETINGVLSYCPFWGSACAGYADKTTTQNYWQPDGDHFALSGYNLSAELIAGALIANSLY